MQRHQLIVPNRRAFARLGQRQRRSDMVAFSFKRRVIGSVVLAGLVSGAALTATGAEQRRNAPPDFSSNFAGWVGLNGGGPFYEPVPGVPAHLSPVVSDPKHPFTP